MKTKIFLITFFILLSSLLYSQGTFKLILGNSSSSEHPTSIIQLTNNNYLCIYFYTKTLKTNTSTEILPITKIFEINNDGVVVKSREFANYRISGIEQTENGFMAYGYAKDENLYKILTIMLDDEWNVTNEKIYTLPFYDPNNGIIGSGLSYNCMLKHNNQYYVTYTVVNSSPPSVNTTCIVLNENLDSIYTSTITNGVVYDFCRTPQNNGFIFCGYTSNYNCYNKFLQLIFTNETFAIQNIYCVDLNLSTFFQNCCIETIDNKIIVNGISLNYYDGDLLGISIFDANPLLIRYNTLGNNEETMKAAIINGLAINEEKDLFVACTYGYNGEIAFDEKDNYTLISKMDTLLNKKWERFVGGDANYDLYNVFACNDGGVIFSTARYDENINNNERDACFIKLNADGCFTNIENKPQNLHNALLYPNPAKETLNLRTAVQYVPATLEVYNISGIKVLAENITATEQTINIASLTTGNYIFRIIFQNETIETGKFIVE